MNKVIAIVLSVSIYAASAEMQAEFHLQNGSVKQGKVLSYTADSVEVLGQFGGSDQVKMFARSMFTSIVLADGTFLPSQPVAEPVATAPIDSFAPADTTVATDTTTAMDTTAATDSVPPAIAPLPLAPAPEVAQEPAFPADAVPEPIESKGLRLTQKIAIGLWGAAIVGAGTGTVFNIMSYQDIDDYDDAYDRRDIHGMDKAESDQDSHIRGRNISYGISLGSLVAGTILWFL